MKFKRDVSAVLSVIMAFSCFGTAAFAETDNLTEENLSVYEEAALSDSAVSVGFPFGAEGTVLKPGVYNIGLSLKDAEDTEQPSAAASCIKSGTLTVDESGKARIKAELKPVSSEDLTGYAFGWKIYAGASAEGEAVSAEETTDEEGNVTAIEFDLPNSEYDGVYVNMYFSAEEASAETYTETSVEAYIETDFSSAISDGSYTADLTLTCEDSEKTSADYFMTKAADITVSDSSIYVKLAYDEAQVGEIIQNENILETLTDEEENYYVNVSLDSLKETASLQISINSEDEALEVSESEENEAAYYAVGLAVDTDTLKETETEEETEDESKTETETESETETETETDESTETTTETAETTTKKSSSSSSSSSSSGSSYYVGTSSSSSSASSYSTVMAAGEVRVPIGSSSVVIDGKRVAMDAAAYIQEESSSTLVPLRFVALAILGGDIEDADESDIVEWNSSKKTATVYAGDDVITFTAGSNIMTVNGEEIEMSYGVKAEITDSRMYIPFRALGEALGVDVEWDSASKTAIYKNK